MAAATQHCVSAAPPSSKPMAIQGGRPMVERGITLIELLVALVIMALLTSIGLASYQSYIQRSRQAEAKITLLALLDRLDQYDLMMAEEEAERVEAILRSEERRVGKECRSRGGRDNEKKKRREREKRRDGSR